MLTGQMEATALSEIFDRAADHLERYGWRQGAIGVAPKAPTCLHGAIAVTSTVDTSWAGYLVSAGLVPSALAPERRRWIEAVWNWNDAPGRTATEVIDMLRYAAKLATMQAERLGS